MEVTPSLNTADVLYRAHLDGLAAKGLESSTPLNPLAAVQNNQSLKRSPSPETTIINNIIGTGGDLVDVLA